MSVNVIINAFGNPTAAAKHQALIGRLMKRMVCGDPEDPTNGRNNTKVTNEERKIKSIERRTAIVDHCTSWKTSLEIAEELGFSRVCIQKHLNIAIQDGRIERNASGTQVFYRKKTRPQNIDGPSSSR